MIEHGSNMRMYYGTRFFVVLCQVLLRNKIYNTQRQKIIQLYSRVRLRASQGGFLVRAQGGVLRKF